MTNTPNDNPLIPEGPQSNSGSEEEINYYDPLNNPHLSNPVESNEDNPNSDPYASTGTEQSVPQFTTGSRDEDQETMNHENVIPESPQGPAYGGSSSAYGPFAPTSDRYSVPPENRYQSSIPNVQPTTHKNAVLALVLSIVGLFVYVTSPFALWMGAKGVKEMNDRTDVNWTSESKTMWIISIILGALGTIGLLFVFAMLIFFIIALTVGTASVNEFGMTVDTISAFLN